MSLPYAELWKPIDGYNGLYEVSNFGNVRSIDRYIESKDGWTSLKRGCQLKPIDNGAGYKYVALWDKGRQTKFYVHRLVAVAFLGSPPSNEHQVAHFDGDRSNNTLSNLRWATVAENESDKIRHGTYGISRPKALCKRGHPLEGKNVNIYSGKRTCRACSLMLNYMSRRESTNEEEMKRISDDYLTMITGDEKVFYQPTCHRGHALSGDNVRMNPGNGKRTCRACEYARKSPAGKKLDKKQRAAYADEVYAERYGGGF